MKSHHFWVQHSRSAGRPIQRTGFLDQKGFGTQISRKSETLRSRDQNRRHQNHASYPYGSTTKCIEDLWSHRAMFGSMHRTPMGRPQNVFKIYGATLLCLAPCIVLLWVDYNMYWRSMEPPCYVWLHASHPYGSTIKCTEDLWSYRAMSGSMHCTTMGRARRGIRAFV